MSEKEEIFSSKIKYTGIFSFKDFYKFCYEWLTEETGLNVAELVYNEKIIPGNKKEIKVEWEGKRKVTDYFRYVVKVKMEIYQLEDIEAVQEGVKVKTNKGMVEVKVKGILERDWQGKFEKDAFRKFLRGLYEKWIIPSRIEQYEDKLINDLDEFLTEAKAFLTLEGKK